MNYELDISCTFYNYVIRHVAAPMLVEATRDFPGA